MAGSSDKLQRELVTVRDTVESIWVAIVLAFVLRAFMVEAFVIPTGSMAPTLLGDHWDLQCKACGYRYAYGLQSPAPHMIEKTTASGTICPNCGYNMNGGDYLYGGDRVLVMKFLYRFPGTSFGEPKPWDVVVFKNPQDGRLNYIKRLIGLPGETIELVHGDVFVRTSKDGPWQIRRKTDSAQEAMWQIVNNSDYPANPQLYEQAKSRPPRWRPDQERLWDVKGYDGRRLAYLGGAGEPAGIRLEIDSDAFSGEHCGYNSSNTDTRKSICGDLKLACDFVPKAADSGVGMHLTSFDNILLAEVTAAGKATLSIYKQDQPKPLWQASTQLEAMKIGQPVSLALTNADLRLTLWVNGRPVLQTADDQYPENHDTLLNKTEQLPEVRLSASGGASELWHVKVFRDVYYTNASLIPVGGDPLFDYAKDKGVTSGRGWGTTGNPITLARHPDKPDLDEFFVMGDNSPVSADGRMWTQASPSLRLDEGYQLGTVPRYAMIGKAFFVYWPAGFPLPGLNLPLVPNVGNMRFIR